MLIDQRKGAKEDSSMTVRARYALGCGGSIRIG